MNPQLELLRDICAAVDLPTHLGIRARHPEPHEARNLLREIWRAVDLPGELACRAWKLGEIAEMPVEGT